MFKTTVISLSSHKDGFKKNKNKNRLHFHFQIWILRQRYVSQDNRWFNFFQVTDHVMAGVEIIVGQFFGDNYIRVSNLFLPKQWLK